VIVKGNYVKRGSGDRKRAKATIRYITHRRDKEGNKVTRDLFGFDGMLSKKDAYRMIDAAPSKRRYFYRIIVSPDPRREDSHKDLSLRNLTIATMLKLEERIGHPIQFVAAIHDDHSSHRHVHTVVILNGRRLTRSDFASIRDHARNRALTERRFLDRRARLEFLAMRSSSYQPPFPFQRRDSARGQSYSTAPVICSYACPVCGRYEALPFNKAGYRCLSDGFSLRRQRSSDHSRTQNRGYAFERTLAP
jgi:hypothetical protein